MCYFSLFTLKLFPTLLAFERMKCSPMFVHRTFICEVSFTDATIRVAGRFLMLVEGVLEVKPLFAVRATKVMKAVTMALKPRSGTEKAVAVAAETVACRALVVF